MYLLTFNVLTYCLCKITYISMWLVTCLICVSIVTLIQLQRLTQMRAVCPPVSLQQSEKSPWATRMRNQRQTTRRITMAQAQMRLRQKGTTVEKLTKATNWVTFSHLKLPQIVGTNSKQPPVLCISSRIMFCLHKLPLLPTTRRFKRVFSKKCIDLSSPINLQGGVTIK